MLGLISAIVSGIRYAVSWSVDEQREQYSRQSSKQYGLPYYIDKHGKQRWVSNGKKRTAQEIYQSNVDEQRKYEIKKNKALEKQCLDSFRKKYEEQIYNKNKISFEEYVVLHMSPVHLKYEAFRKIKKNVSEERIRELRENIGCHMY